MAAMLEMLPFRNRTSVLQSVAPLQKAHTLHYPSNSKRRRPMNLDSALEPDSESVESPPPGTKTGPPNVGTHTQRVAALFRDEYPKLVHYMVSKTGSWPEARD